MDKKELIELIKGLNKSDIKTVKDTLGISGGNTSAASRSEMINQAERQLKIEMDLNKILIENANHLGDLTERNKQNIELLERKALMELDSLRAAGELSANDEEHIENQKELMRILDEIEKYGVAKNTALIDEHKNLKSIIDDFQKEQDIKKGSAILDKAGVTVHKDIAKTLGIKVEVQDTFLGQLGMIGSLLGDNEEKNKQILAGLKNQVKEAFHYRKVAASVFSAIFENSKKMFESFDKAQAALAATTGQGQEFNDTLYEVGRQGNLFGVTMEKAGAAIGTLVNETSNFTSLSKSLQANIGLSVAKMEQLGVSTADSAKIFQNFNQGLGITASESIEMQKELAMAGVSIGISASKITKDFNASLSTLMVYGRESIDVFKGIAAAAKAAGVETSTLLSIAGKFDTFAGAAEGAGKLNALLGTQLSTTELLMATEDERIRMLVESVQSQGVAFQDMDRFTQKAIANAAGISDMSEANRIFGMSLGAYDENQRKLQASADVQKKFDDAVAKTIPVMEKFKLLGAEMVVALEPFLDTLGSVAESLTGFFKEMDTGTKESLATFLTVLSGIVMITPVIKGFLKVFKLFGPTVGVADKVAKKSGKGFAKFGKNMGKGLANAGRGLVSFGAGLVATMAPIVAFVAVAALLAAAIAGIGYAFSAVIDSGAKFYDMMFGVSDGEAKVKEFEARAAEAMATIVSSNHEGALSSIKAMVSEVNKMGQDVKVSSTIENLALVTAGKATNITGQRVAASTTNVTANVQNVFEGLELFLNIDGEKVRGIVTKMANGEA